VFFAAAMAVNACAHAKQPECNGRSRASRCSSFSTNTAPTISGSPAGAVTTGQSYAFTPSASL
jgi:hypothetical protein